MVIVAVAFFGGVTAIWLDGHTFDVLSIVRATTVLALAIAWLLIRWHGPRQQ